MPVSVEGRLTGPSDFSGYRVVATFAVPSPAEPDLTVPERRTAQVGDDGRFVLQLPEGDERSGATRFAAISPAGIELTHLDRSESELSKPLELAVPEPPQPLAVQPAADPALGARVTYSGRVIDTAGSGAPEGLLVVLWGTPPGGKPEDARPLDVSMTSAGGYFYGRWPGERLEEAHAVVAGGKPVQIAPEEERLPQRFAVVLEELPPAPEAKDEDCECEETPRAPSQAELTESGEAFAADPSRCANFTIPNRALEEATFQAVVRTTQPDLRGTPLLRPVPLPVPLGNRLRELARVNDDPPELPRPEREPFRPELVSVTKPQVLAEAFGDKTLARHVLTSAKELLGGIDLDGDLAAEERTPAKAAAAVVAGRAAPKETLRLESGVLSDLARESRPLTPIRLVDAELASTIGRVRGEVDTLASAPARFELSQSQQVDWDELPLAQQATTIAHGHLLTFKQVWKADGYSLGDLLYSLPLAPGQQKLVSILDWDRLENARRDAHRVTGERLDADLSHERDVSDVISSILRERLDAESHADVGAVGGALGGFIGPLVFGAAGGVSSASSTAHQTSGRDLSGSALNQLRDRTMQAASAVRSQRASVVQTSRQGESVKATTEALANYNHCHAMTVQYFEVLRHMQVSQELHDVQECLFVPMAITPFTRSKAGRWRNLLAPNLRRPSLRGSFSALERVNTDWAEADVPPGRYADEPVVDLSGEIALSMELPRPKDTDSDGFDQAQWQPYADYLSENPEDVFKRYLGTAHPSERAAIWDNTLAPRIAQRIVNKFKLELIQKNGPAHPLDTDATLVSTYSPRRPLTVGLRVDSDSLDGWSRAQIAALRLTAPDAPAPARMTVTATTFRYRTDHLAHALVTGQRSANDLHGVDAVEMATPLDAAEEVNPHQRDERLADELVEHLNEEIEHYHRAIWMEMDPNRRYLLLDGFIAPDAGGRSVASVVENRIVGIVGNSLVMPLRPGAKLDPTYKFSDAKFEDLRHLYAEGSAPPMRISLPTRGVFAEAVLGSCNSCEMIDDTRFWRFEEAPIPDTPTAISPLSTDSRRQPPPDLTADPFPAPVVRLQQAPAAPDPTGLAAAMKTLGTAGLFRNITGLALNQANSAQALKTAITTAQSFASQAGALAQQRYMAGEIDRTLDHIKAARDKQMIAPEQAQRLAESAMRAALGETRPKPTSTTENKAVSDLVDRSAGAKNAGTFRLAGPRGTVEVETGKGTEGGKVDAKTDPPVEPIQEATSILSWAAAATMMLNWKQLQSRTVEATMAAIGEPWKAKYASGSGLSPSELRQLAAKLKLQEEGPASYSVQGLVDLLSNHGPLWTITDDAFGSGNNLVQVRILVAVQGDGTPAGTTVKVVDSASGSLKTESFAGFQQRLEASDPVAAGVGILHW